MFYSPKLEAVEPLLKAMHENGLGVPHSVVQYIQENAGDEMTETVAELLVELSSGKLMPTDLIAFRSFNTSKYVNQGAQKFIQLTKDHNLAEALKEKEVVFLLLFLKFIFMTCIVFLVAGITQFRLFGRIEHCIDGPVCPP